MIAAPLFISQLRKNWNGYLKILSIDFVSCPLYSLLQSINLF